MRLKRRLTSLNADTAFQDEQTVHTKQPFNDNGLSQKNLRSNF